MEPPAKRGRLVNNRSSDFTRIFPIEVATKVFLLLPTKVIFRKCALVCKRWNNILSSTNFWQSLLVYEFGPNVTERLGEKRSQICDLLSTNVSWDSFQSPWIEIKGFFSSIEPLLEELRKRRRKIEAVESARLSWFRLLNLAKVVPHFELGLVQLNFEVAVRPEDGTVGCSFYLLDGDFNVISKLEQGVNPDTVWCFSPARCLPGARYLVSVHSPSRVRLVFPSDSFVTRRRTVGNSKALLEAARKGEKQLVTEILKTGQAEVESFKGARALVEAAKNDHVDVIDVLLNADADINAPDCDLVTPLGAAAAKGHEKSVRFLLDHRANVDGDDKQPPLLIAIKQGHATVVKMLLKSGAFANTTRDGQNPAHYLAQYFAKQYFNSEKASVSSYEEDACDILELLVMNGCHINAMSFKRTTPFMEACRHSHVSLARKIVKMGGYPLLTWESDFELPTALFGVLQCDSYLKKYRIEMLKFLFELGGLDYLEEEYLDCPTPLGFAFSECESLKKSYYDFELFKFLIEHKANVNIDLPSRNMSFGKRSFMSDAPTLLLRALHYSMVPEAKLLIEAGADVSKPDKDGITPLMLAAKGEDAEVIELLINKGTAINERDDMGRTALIHAALASLPTPQAMPALPSDAPAQGITSSGDKEDAKVPRKIRLGRNADVVDALLRRGADRSLKDESGRTALDYLQARSTELENACRVLKSLTL